MARGVADERVTDTAFTVIPRTGGEVEHHVAALGGELAHGHDAVVEAAGGNHRVRPDIFANGDADAAAVELDDGGLFGGLEITVFVKDVVGRQEALAGGDEDFALMAKGGGVESRAAAA